MKFFFCKLENLSFIISLLISCGRNKLLRYFSIDCCKQPVHTTGSTSGENWKKYIMHIDKVVTKL